jgi:hypothetical protein
LKKTTFSPGLLRQAAKRLAMETGFTLTEIETMPFYDMAWWLVE